MMTIDDAAALFVVEHDNKAQFFSCVDIQDRTPFCKGDIDAPHCFIIVKSLEDILVDEDYGTNKVHSAPSWSSASQF